MCQFFHNVKNRVILWCLLLYADAEGQWRFCSLSYMDASFLYTIMFVFLWLFYLFFQMHSVRSLAPLEQSPFIIMQYKPLQHKVYVYVNRL